MGRRSINTTKSGKYMNPTDQARKEARKKELKKNKKQRQLVRAAVLKNKDPSQILEEMEKIDEMEYNVLQPSPLNEKVLRDKRKKLKETFDRVMRLYHNEDPEQWSELKRRETEYEKKRLKKQHYYESVKYAQSVQIDEIPLPSTTPNTNDVSTNPNLKNSPTQGRLNAISSIGLPSVVPPPFFMGKSNSEVLDEKTVNDKAVDLNKKCAMGVPVGLPPDLFKMHDLDSDFDESSIVLKKYVPKTTSVSDTNSSVLERSLLAISGQNIDEFMREMENVHKDMERENSMASSGKGSTENENLRIETTANNRQQQLPGAVKPAAANTNEDISLRVDSQLKLTRPPFPMPHLGKLPPDNPLVKGIVRPPPPPPQIVTGNTSMMPPPMSFRPPPPRPSMMQNYGAMGGPLPPALRQPGGAPSGIRHSMMSGTHPGRIAAGIRIPGPPPGLPTRMSAPQKSQPTSAIATITAKPQIRNLSADVTRFVPSALRIKRNEDTSKQKRQRTYMNDRSSATASSSFVSLSSSNMHQNAQTKKLVTKDDAYMQFMNEMQDLL